MIDLGNLVSGLIVAAAGGLAYLAYRHPITFHRLYWWLQGILFTTFIGLVTWDISRKQVLMDLMPLIHKEKYYSAVEKIVHDGEVLSTNVYLFFLGIWGYFIIISIVGYFLWKENQEKQQNDKEGF